MPVNIQSLLSTPVGSLKCYQDHLVMTAAFKITPKTIGILLAMVTFLSASGLFNQFLLTSVPFPFPFFTALFYEAWTITGIFAYMLYLRCRGKSLNISTIRALPYHIHIVAFLFAIGHGLFFISIQYMGVPTVYSISSMEAILYIFIPMLIAFTYRPSYQFTKPAILVVTMGLILVNTLTLALNPRTTSLGIILTLLWVMISVLVDLLCGKLRFEYNVNAQTILFYLCLESLVWLFGFAFVIDLRGITTHYYDALSIGFSYLPLGAFIEMFKHIIFFYFKYTLPYDERAPYIKQWIMFVGIGLGLAIFGAIYNAVNYVGMVATFIFSVGYEYSNRGKEMSPSDQVGVVQLDAQKTEHGSSSNNNTATSYRKVPSNDDTVEIKSTNTSEAFTVE